MRSRARISSPVGAQWGKERMPPPPSASAAPCASAPPLPPARAPITQDRRLQNSDPIAFCRRTCMAIRRWRFESPKPPAPCVDGLRVAARSACLSRHSSEPRSSVYAWRHGICSAPKPVRGSDGLPAAGLCYLMPSYRRLINPDEADAVVRAHREAVGDRRGSCADW